MLASTNQVHVRGARITYRSWGSTGPKVLLLHGSPDNSALWEPVASHLQGELSLIAPDLPGFGGSGIPDGYDRSLASMSQFVEDFRTAACLEGPVDLVGHDFGGAFALSWAIEHPDLVRRAVLMNTSFFGDYRWHFWARVWRTPVLGEISMATMTRPMFAQEIRRGSGRQISREHNDQTWSALTRATRAEVLRLYRAADPSRLVGWEERLPALAARAPLMVIWGDKDPYLPNTLADRFGAQAVKRLPGVGHWPPVEAPDEVSRYIRAFLATSPEEARRQL